MVQPIVIQKYGGSSVATIAKIEAIAQRVDAEFTAQLPEEDET